MKRNTVTLVIGSLLILIFFVLLFAFQVRYTEVAVVTTFDKPGAPIREPGLYFQWPWPIQKVYRLDKRIQNFDGRYDQLSTKGGEPLMVMLYVGWGIKDPETFFASFRGGKTAEAESKLSGLVESAKSQIVGNHPFSHFISTDEKELRFDEIEKEILEKVQPDAEKKYGIEVKFIGIEKLGLPESVTEKVFARMQAERDKVVKTTKSRGEADAMKIRSATDTERAGILSEADAKATALRGAADAEASKWLSVLSQNPELAVFLMKIKALEEVLSNKTILILDQRTAPLDLLLPQPKPAAPTNGVPLIGSATNSPIRERN